MLLECKLINTLQNSFKAKENIYENFVLLDIKMSLEEGTWFQCFTTERKLPSKYVWRKISPLIYEILFIN